MRKRLSLIGVVTVAAKRSTELDTGLGRPSVERPEPMTRLLFDRTG